MKRFRAVSALRIGLLTLVAALVVGVPVWAVLVNSAKTFQESQDVGLDLPDTWQLVDNYTQVVTADSFLRQGKNSIVVAIVVIGLLLITGSMAAWVFARARARTTRFIYYYALCGLILPLPVVAMIKVLNVLGLGGQPALIAVLAGVAMSLAIFLMTGFIKTIPYELEEAARLDGANRGMIFVRIILPLLQPVLITAALFMLVIVWNEFYLPLFVLENATDQTLPLGMYNLFGDQQVTEPKWNLIFAFVTVSSLLPVVLFLFAQRWILSGVTAGAVKQ